MRTKFECEKCDKKLGTEYQWEHVPLARKAQIEADYYHNHSHKKK